MKRLSVGLDGNCIYVGLGSMPEGDFVFHEIDNSPKAPSLREQALRVVELWFEEFPEKGRIPFDFTDGL